MREKAGNAAREAATVVPEGRHPRLLVGSRSGEVPGSTTPRFCLQGASRQALIVRQWLYYFLFPVSIVNVWYLKPQILPPVVPLPLLHVENSPGHCHRAWLPQTLYHPGRQWYTGQILLHRERQWFVLLPKKSSLKLIEPSSFFAAVPSKGNVVTRNISPAPSASLPVMIGVCK